MSSQSSKVLRELAFSIKTMTQPSSACMHLETSKNAIKDLKTALQITSSSEYTSLFEFLPVLTVVSMLTDIVRCVEDIYGVVTELSQQAQFNKKVEHDVPNKTPQMLHRGVVNPIDDYNKACIVITIHEITSESPRKDETPPPKG